MELLVHRIDQRRYTTVITRRDGVRFVVGGVGLKFAIPHDLAHLAVEGALGLHRGFWGTIAMGGVFRSMQHLDGRRRPHADAHSHDILKANRGWVVEAEGLVALFNSAFEADNGPESTILRSRLREFAWTPPGGEPREFGDRQIRAVWTAWHKMHALWTPLPIGERLKFVWSGEPVESSGRSRDRRRRHEALVTHVAV